MNKNPVEIWDDATLDERQQRDHAGRTMNRAAFWGLLRLIWPFWRTK